MENKATKNAGVIVNKTNNDALHKTMGDQGNISGETVREVLKEQRLDRVQINQKLANQKLLQELMRTPIVVSNHTVREFRNEFFDVADWVVSYFFPVAKDDKGNTVPTYVDTPRNERTLKICERKAAIMKKLGHRYIVCEINNQLTAEQVRKALTVSDEESMTKDNHVVNL